MDYQKKKLVKMKGNKINKRKQKFNPKKKENKNGLRNHWQHSKKFDGCKHSHLEFGNFHRCLFTLASKIKPLFHSLSFTFHCSPLCLTPKQKQQQKLKTQALRSSIHTHKWGFCKWVSEYFVVFWIGFLFFLKNIYQFLVGFLLWKICVVKKWWAISSFGPKRLW